MNRSLRNLLIVLVGFPLVYILYSLSPWSTDFFVNGNNSLFIIFWSIILILHWASFFLVMTFLRQENKTLKDIGFRLNRKRTIIMILSYLVIALLVFGYTEWSLKFISLDEEKLLRLSNFYPKTTDQRLLFIFTVFTAGFCEEVIYRGYAITKLVEKGVNKWFAIIPAAVSFTLIHGVSSIFSTSHFFSYFGFGLLFGLFFVASKRLLPNMIIHFLFNLSAMLAVFQCVAG